MKVPFVKEWGSWVVFVSCCLTAVAAAVPRISLEPGGDIFIGSGLTIIGLALLINAKNPASSLIRSKGRNTEQLIWLLFFTITGVALLAPFLFSGIKDFMVLFLLVLLYVLLLMMGREHHILAEMNGFALLTLSAPIVYFVMSGELSMKLYAAVLIFFWAGVFKVRLRIRKTHFFRQAMVLYCMAATAAYLMLNISIMLLLPLLENVVSAVVMREEKLRETGYIELSKSIAFIILIAFFWQ
jgi:hypothetical protein